VYSPFCYLFPPLLRLLCDRKRRVSMKSSISDLCRRLISHKYFDRFIISVIALNSLFLAMADYSNVDETGALVSDGSWRNTLISRSELVFTLIFTMECALKITALGFTGKQGYIHDPWNWLDFVVVITGSVFLLSSFFFLSDLSLPQMDLVSSRSSKYFSYSNLSCHQTIEKYFLESRSVSPSPLSHSSSPSSSLRS
jgi:hypothetical protein